MRYWSGVQAAAGLAAILSASNLVLGTSSAHDWQFVVRHAQELCSLREGVSSKDAEEHLAVAVESLGNRVKELLAPPHDEDTLMNTTGDLVKLLATTNEGLTTVTDACADTYPSAKSAKDTLNRLVFQMRLFSAQTMLQLVEDISTGTSRRFSVDTLSEKLREMMDDLQQQQQPDPEDPDRVPAVLRAWETLDDMTSNLVKACGLLDLETPYGPEAADPVDTVFLGKTIAEKKMLSSLLEDLLFPLWNNLGKAEKLGKPKLGEDLFKRISALKLSFYRMVLVILRVLGDTRTTLSTTSPLYCVDQMMIVKTNMGILQVMAAALLETSSAMSQRLPATASLASAILTKNWEGFDATLPIQQSTARIRTLERHRDFLTAFITAFSSAKQQDVASSLQNVANVVATLAIGLIADFIQAFVTTAERDMVLLRDFATLPNRLEEETVDAYLERVDSALVDAFSLNNDVKAMEKFLGENTVREQLETERVPVILAMRGELSTLSQRLSKSVQALVNAEQSLKILQSKATAPASSLLYDNVMNKLDTMTDTLERITRIIREIDSLAPPEKASPLEPTPLTASRGSETSGDDPVAEHLSDEGAPNPTMNEPEVFLVTLVGREAEPDPDPEPEPEPEPESEDKDKDKDKTPSENTSKAETEQPKTSSGRWKLIVPTGLLLVIGGAGVIYGFSRIRRKAAEELETADLGNETSN